MQVWHKRIDSFHHPFVSFEKRLFHLIANYMLLSFVCSPGLNQHINVFKKEFEAIFLKSFPWFGWGDETLEIDGEEEDGVGLERPTDRCTIIIIYWLGLCPSASLQFSCVNGQKWVFSRYYCSCRKSGLFWSSPWKKVHHHHPYLYSSVFTKKKFLSSSYVSWYDSSGCISDPRTKEKEWVREWPQFRLSSSCLKTVCLPHEGLILSVLRCFSWWSWIRWWWWSPTPEILKKGTRKVTNK